MAKAERRKQQLAEEEARRPRDEDGKPGGSPGQAGMVASFRTQMRMLAFLSQALQGFSSSSRGPWVGLPISELLSKVCGSALQSGRGLGSKKRCVSSTPCWRTSGRASSYGRQPGAGETLKQVAEWPQQILQRPQSLVRPEPVTFSLLPPTTSACVCLQEALRDLRTIRAPYTHCSGDV